MALFLSFAFVLNKKIYFLNAFEIVSILIGFDCPIHNLVKMLNLPKKSLSEVLYHVPISGSHDWVLIQSLGLAMHTENEKRAVFHYFGLTILQY